jgi:hypothetical protein
MCLKGLHHQVCFVSFRPTKEECYLLWWWDLVKKSIFLLTFLLRIWFVWFFLEANWKKAHDGFMSMALFGWEALLSFCVISERVKLCTCCGVRRVAQPHVISIWCGVKRVVECTLYHMILWASYCCGVERVARHPLVSNMCCGIKRVACCPCTISSWSKICCGVKRVAARIGGGCCYSICYSIL